MRAGERFSHLDRAAVAAADRYIDAARSLKDRSYTAAKIYTAVNLFLWHLDAFERDEHPVPLFVDVFDAATRWLIATGDSQVCGHYFGEVEDVTVDTETIGAVFGEVYAEYTDDQYFTESQQVLRDRLTANGVNPSELFKDRVVLEAGCGGGKFAAAIASMGAAKVIGVDIATDAISYAVSQAKKVPYGDRLEYRVGSVLDLPLPDQSVDLVWSNSVIHLTTDWDRCFAEAARVLKSNGVLYVYVDGDFGLFDLLVWCLRQVCRQVPIQMFHAYLKALGMNAGRISWIIPTLYLPYAGKPREEVEELLRRNGFTDLEQLTRGIAIDQIEQVSSNVPFAAIKYGEAQLKYLAKKTADSPSAN